MISQRQVKPFHTFLLITDFADFIVKIVTSALSAENSFEKPLANIGYIRRSAFFQSGNLNRH